MNKLNKPIIFILGTTGAGKTKVSIEIAKLLNSKSIPAEIISADSMQIYKGLDIVSAKVTQSEASGIPHHCLDLLEPTTTNFTVHDFRAHALPIIDQLHSKHTIRLLLVTRLISYFELVKSQKGSYRSSQYWNILIPL